MSFFYIICYTVITILLSQYNRQNSRTTSKMSSHIHKDIYIIYIHKHHIHILWNWVWRVETKLQIQSKRNGSYPDLETMKLTMTSIPARDWILLSKSWGGGSEIDHATHFKLCWQPGEGAHNCHLSAGEARQRNHQQVQGQPVATSRVPGYSGGYRVRWGVGWRKMRRSSKMWRMRRKQFISKQKPKPLLAFLSAVRMKWERNRLSLKERSHLFPSFPSLWWVHTPRVTPGSLCLSHSSFPPQTVRL